MLEPVKWSFQTKVTGLNTAELQFIATIEKGWHLYSQTLPPDGPLPTEFTYGKKEGVELVGKANEPKGHEEFDNMFQMKVKFFDKSATFIQKVKLTSEKPTTVSGLIRFQACNDESCIPGETEFSFELPGASVKPAAATEPKASQAEPQQAVATEVKQETASVPATALTKEKSVVQPAANNDDFSGKNRSLLWFFLQAFAWGLLAILTPCVFPMIPLTVS
ncbi:MAG TPA: protein-disulfide reductase DsbD domain-containing protein, partial [Prolixibacteraceae bacterium]|nr:protein-disulfide reductase DsbD domain-containing protein [Prolixibacteraceae bacterium]